MSGKPIEQFPLLWIGRQVSDQRALGRLCKHLLQVQFHVLHRRRNDVLGRRTTGRFWFPTFRKSNRKRSFNASAHRTVCTIARSTSCACKGADVLHFGGRHPGELTQSSICAAGVSPPRSPDAFVRMLSGMPSPPLSRRSGSRLPWQRHCFLTREAAAFPEGNKSSRLRLYLLIMRIGIARGKPCEPIFL